MKSINNLDGCVDGWKGKIKRIEVCNSYLYVSVD